MIDTDAVNRRLSLLEYADITETQPYQTMTAVEQRHLKGQPVTARQHQFMDTGALIIENCLSHDTIKDYCQFRESLPKDRNERDNYYGGFAYPTPFMLHPELRDIACAPEIMAMLTHLTSETMALNLSLTGWVSTERDWHSDQYLNPRGLWSHYVAVWIALEDIDADSGPFQYVPGSHKWPVMVQDKLFSHLTPEERESPHWPTFTQTEVARMCSQQIKRRGADVVTYLPKRGDVLFWHSNLVHRGSKPNNPNLLRKALIGHYSSIPVRTGLDMPKVNAHKQGWYFELPTDGAVRP